MSLKFITTQTLRDEYNERRNGETNYPDIRADEAMSIKVVAVAGSNPYDWAAYVGPTQWSDQKVAEQGEKLNKQMAELLFRDFFLSGRYYRE